jgi:beta-lactamase regulating signal transducer with metallopeptidase domain
MNMSDTLQRFAELWWQTLPAWALQAAVLVVLAAVAATLLRSLPAQFRYGLWALVLLRIALPFGLHSPLGLLPSPNAGAAALETAGEGTLLGASEVASAPGLLPASEGIAFAAPLPPSRGLMDAEITAALPLTPPQLLFLLWAGLVAAMLTLWAVRAWQVHRLLATGAATAPAALQQEVADLGRSLGLRQEVPVQVLPADGGLATPAVFGVFRPRILLPAELVESTTQETLKPVLLHELLHIRRGDPWVNFLQGLVQILYFFHPFVWWANRQLRRERELACDEAVVRELGGESRSYMACLIDFARRLRPVRRIQLPMPAMAESKSFLKQRLERLARRPRHLSPLLRQALGAAVLAFALFASLLATRAADPPAHADLAGAQVVQQTAFLAPGGLQDPSRWQQVQGAAPLRLRNDQPLPPLELPTSASGSVLIQTVVDPEGQVAMSRKVSGEIEPEAERALLSYLQELRFQPLGASSPRGLHRAAMLDFELREGQLQRPPKVDSADGTQAWLRSTYFLPKGRHLVLVPQADAEARRAYFQQASPVAARLNPQGPTVLVFHWDRVGRPRLAAQGYGTGTGKSLLSLIGIDAHEVVDPANLLDFPVAYDVLLRPESEREELLADLTQELRGLGIAVAFDLHSDLQPTLVVKGRLGTLAHDPVHPQFPTLDVYGDEKNEDPFVSEGGKMDLREASSFLGRATGYPVLLEAETTQETANQPFHLVVHSSARQPEMLNLVLSHIEEQTELKLSIENRLAERVYAVPAGTGLAAASAANPTAAER